MRDGKYVAVDQTKDEEGYRGMVLPIRGVSGFLDVHDSVQFEGVEIKGFGCSVLFRRTSGVDEALGILLRQHKIIRLLITHKNKHVSASPVTPACTRYQLMDPREACDSSPSVRCPR